MFVLHYCSALWNQQYLLVSPQASVCIVANIASAPPPVTSQEGRLMDRWISSRIWRWINLNFVKDFRCRFWQNFVLLTLILADFRFFLVNCYVRTVFRVLVCSLPPVGGLYLFTLWTEVSSVRREFKIGNMELQSSEQPFALIYVCTQTKGKMHIHLHKHNICNVLQSFWF